MKVAALCDFPYWEGNVGTAIRYESLCQMISSVCDLTVISSATVQSKYTAAIEQRPYTLVDRKALQEIHDGNILPNIPGVRSDRQMVVAAIRHYCLNNGIDAVLTPYFNREWMIKHLPGDIVRIVDTHDCQSQRTRSFALHGLSPTFAMTSEEEAVELEKYDLAISMSDEDYAEFTAISDIPVVTAPFRLPIRNIYYPKKHAADLLFIAAKSDVNDITLAYLMKEVMPLVTQKANLHIVGNVTVPDVNPRNTNIVRHQRVEDLADIYRKIDIAVNPTYAGGGVKTKTLEAICYGVPTVTSDEGARGMRHLIPDELIANDKETFAYRISTLLKDHRLRSKMSKKLIQNLVREDADGWTENFGHLLAAIRERKMSGILA